MISDKTIAQKCAQEPWMVQTVGHIKLGRIPEWFEEIASQFPQGSNERAAYFKAADSARAIYRGQVKNTFNIASFNDPEIVRALCAAEPWTTASRLTELSNGVFGFVTEKLERARDLFPEDTPEHQTLNDAFECAKLAYFDQIKLLSRNFATGKTRAQVEEMNSQLWAWAHRLEGDGTYLTARLIKVCEWNGEYFRGFGVPNVPNPGIQQFRAQFK